MASKQHQVLAVEPTRQAAAEKQMTECANTFSKKDTLFTGDTRTLTMFGKDPGNTVVLEALEQKGSTKKDVQNTVPENLNYMAGVVGLWFDTLFQKELNNQTARADVVINGKTIIPGAPATYLLGLENKLSKVREVYVALPTLAPGIAWSPATDIGKNIWKGPLTTDVKTEKTTEHVRLTQSNEKHPDTFVAKEIINNVGKYIDQKFSGMISVAEKASMLARLDNLLMAVKDARMRANDVESTEVKCSMAMFEYLHGQFHDDKEVLAAVQK